MPGPYTHPKATKTYDTPASYAARKVAEQQSAITATAPARKQAQTNEAQRGHNLAQSISDDVSLQAGPIGQAQVGHARERLENDRYNALTPGQRSSEYDAKMKMYEDVQKDPLSHGAMTTSQTMDVQQHQSDINNLRKQVLSDPTFQAQTGLDTNAVKKPALAQEQDY